MSDDTPNEPMTVTLHKDDQPDFSVEQGALETVGISVENAVPKEDLRALIEEWRETADEISDPQESINALQACANQVENLL